MDINIDILGLREFIDEISTAPAEIRKALSAALNSTAKKTRTKATKLIREQINLSPSEVRRGLVIGDTASGRSLQATVNAYRTAKSLGTFVVNDRGRGQGVNVSVSPGNVSSMPKAFRITVRGHKILVTRSSNIAGNKKSLKSLFGGLYVLYAPTIDQAFISATDNGVAEDLEGWIKDKMGDEFVRLIDEGIFADG